MAYKPNFLTSFNSEVKVLENLLLSRRILEGEVIDDNFAMGNNLYFLVLFSDVTSGFFIDDSEHLLGRVTRLGSGWHR